LFDEWMRCCEANYDHDVATPIVFSNSGMETTTRRPRLCGNTQNLRMFEVEETLKREKTTKVKRGGYSKG